MSSLSQTMQLGTAQGESEPRKEDVQGSTATAQRSSQHSDVPKSSDGASGPAAWQDRTVHGLRVAIVCDWLTGIGGAERVVFELHKLFPDAPIYTSQYNPQAIPWFADADVRTTWLQKLPKSFRKFLPLLRRWAFEKLDLSEYDLILSSSGAEAKGVKKRAGALHINYCHSPTHYYWVRYDEYMHSPGFGFFNPLARIGLKLLVGPMRRWDKKAAARPDIMIANSTFTQANIKKFYGRDSIVIHPPVEIGRFAKPSSKERNNFVCVGRQTPYKRFDLAVAACTELSLPLTVVGSGPEHEKLKQLAGPTVTFAASANDATVADYFCHATALIFPGMEDFGITAVEAMAAGTPVIAYKAGGALDYVIPSKTGLFFEKQSTESLVNALHTFKVKEFNSETIRKHAAQFDSEVFREHMEKLIQKSLRA